MAKARTSEISRAREVVRRLKIAYPDAACSLTYGSTHELLVATILSAQCTDERVNQTTPALFQRYKTPSEFAHADLDELSQAIRSCGYHNQKARSIRGASLRIVEEYGGRVPDNLAELVKLPGVGRKTANCVLGECFGQPALVIDTHMVRIMNLLGFVVSRNPEQIERELALIFDRQDWVVLTHLIIDHGRAVCIARRPRCSACVLADLCPAAVL